MLVLKSDPIRLSYHSIHNPAEVRLVLLLIQILNYMWIEAMFWNSLEVTERCILDSFCFEASWILLKFTAVVFSQIVSIPARVIMYVLSI